MERKCVRITTWKKLNEVKTSEKSVEANPHLHLHDTESNYYSYTVFSVCCQNEHQTVFQLDNCYRKEGYRFTTNNDCEGMKWTSVPGQDFELLFLIPLKYLLTIFKSLLKWNTNLAVRKKEPRLPTYNRMKEDKEI